MEIQNQDNKPTESITVPGAIIGAGIIIAIAILITSNGATTNVVAPNEPNIVTEGQKQRDDLANNMVPISESDHILGNPNAPVKIVEYSDLECPFCQRLHPIMKQIMEIYGKEGKVAWVYRHFPLKNHPNAFPEAVASECVASIKGNLVFWDFIDRFFVLSQVNGLTDLSVARNVALGLGVDAKAYDECILSKKFDTRIQAQITDGINTGVSGTPYSIIIAKNGKKFVVSGALPMEAFSSAIDSALAEK